MNPRIINAISKGYEGKMNDIDYLMWTMGSYVEVAVLASIDRALNGRKAKSKYLEKPFSMMDKEFEENSENIKNRESKEQVAIYEMKQRINLLRQQGLPESPI